MIIGFAIGLILAAVIACVMAALRLGSDADDAAGRD